MRALVRALALLSVALALVVVVGGIALYRPDIPYRELDSAYRGEASAFATGPRGLEIHYRDQGVASGRTLVLVHGYASSLHTWEPWVGELRDDVRVVSIDLPAHGLTRTPETYNFDRNTFADAIDAVADKLELNRFILVGNSMGGEAAWSYALERPDRLDALVLIDAAGWKDGVDKSETPLAIQALRSPIGPLIRNIDSTLLMRRGLEMAFADPSLVSEAMVRRYVDLSRAPGHRAGLLALSSGSPARRSATIAALSQISVPTLVLHGDLDRLIPVAAGRRFASAIPGAQLVVYGGVGHLPQEEVPSRSAQDLLRFLEAELGPPPRVGAPLAAALR